MKYKDANINYFKLSNPIVLQNLKTKFVTNDHVVDAILSLEEKKYSKIKLTKYSLFCFLLFCYSMSHSINYAKFPFYSPHGIFSGNPSDRCMTVFQRSIVRMQSQYTSSTTNLEVYCRRQFCLKQNGEISRGKGVFGKSIER